MTTGSWARRGLAGFLAAGCAAAQALSLTFSGSGQVTGPAQTPPLLTQLEVTTANSQYTFGGQSGWTQSSLFSFNAATLTGGGSGVFSKGADSLSFTFTSSAAALGAPLLLNLVVTSGTGAYARYTGTGTSQVQLLGDPLGLPTPIPFTDSKGVLTLSPVPEASTTALMLLGLLALGARAAAGRRR